MSKYTKAKLDKLTEEEINKRIMSNLLSLSITLNQLRTLSARNNNKDAADTIHASLAKNKIVIDSIQEEIDFKF